jgi:hypothetical protein
MSNIKLHCTSAFQICSNNDNGFLKISQLEYVSNITCNFAHIFALDAHILYCIFNCMTAEAIYLKS